MDLMASKLKVLKLLLALVLLTLLSVFLFLQNKTIPGFPNTGAPTAGLVDYWTFDTVSVSGSSVADSGSANITGTLIGSPTPVTGKIGQAFSFVGNSNYINFGDNEILDSTTAFTLSVWMKRGAAGAITGIEKFGSSPIKFHTYSDGLMYGVMNGAFSGFPDPNDTNWHLYTWVFDGSLGSDRLILYTDGVSGGGGTSQIGSVITGNNAGDFTVGVLDFETNSNGAFDEVRIYNRAITPSEVLDIFNYTGGVTDVTPPIPGNSGTITTANITGTSLTLNWTKAADDVTSEANLVYKVYRSESNNIDTVANAQANGTLIQAYTADINSLNVTGLSYDTTYYFNVIARDEALNTVIYTTKSETTPAATLTTGLLNHWTFDASSIVGGTVLDSGSANITGTIVGSPAPVAGHVGEAFSFVGNSNYINFGDNGILDSKTVFTLSAWFKRGAVNSITSIEKYSSGGGESVGFNTYSDGKFYPVIAAQYTGIDDPNDTSWHLYTMVFDGSLIGNAARLKIYIDGSFVANNFPGTIGAVTPDSSGNFTVGLANFTPSTNAAIDDVRIYDRALSPSNVLQLYNWIAADTTAPAVSMTSPSDGVTVFGSSVSLSANASDNVGVAGVQFKLDTSTNIGSEDTTSTYGVTFDSTAISDGSHTLTAVARDAASNLTTSSAVTVTVDNTAPVRSLGSPSTALAIGTTSTTISLTTNENATCKYSTSSGTAYGSMTAFSSSASTSHSTSVSGLVNGGSYVYYIKCSDTQGNINATDYNISFTVASDTTFPAVSITSPSNNATVLGNAVAISANASDDIAVAGVQFKLDTNTNIGAEDTTSPYGLVWDSTTVTDGQHTLKAVARDATGNHTTSAVITVNIENTPPVVDTGPSGSGSLSTGDDDGIGIGGDDDTVLTPTIVPPADTSTTVPPIVIPSCNGTTGFSTITGESCAQNTGGTTVDNPSNISGPLVYNFGIPNLKFWSKGEAVKEVQRFLNKSLNMSLVVDGILGMRTIGAIRLYQKNNGLVADGLVGQKTKAKMNISVQNLPNTGDEGISPDAAVKPSPQINIWPVLLGLGVLAVFVTFFTLHKKRKRI